MEFERIRRLILFAFVALAIWPTADTWAEANESELELKGVIVSPSGRWALINGRVLGLGDHVGSVEITDIDRTSVLLRTRKGEQVLNLGSTFRPGTTRIRPPRKAPAIEISTTPPVAAAAEEEDRRRTGPIRTDYHRVLQGETLFGIATDYFGQGEANPTARTDSVADRSPSLPGSAHLHRAMVALYEANPEAFGASMNIVYEGAWLRIPEPRALARVDAKAATAEVARQVDHWRSNGAAFADVRGAPERETADYGPVAAGETLSEIASRLRPSDVTLDQMMMAVYDANPKAFRGNINLLRKGTTLSIPNPSGSALDGRRAALATERVARHMKEWPVVRAPRSGDVATAPGPASIDVVSLGNRS